MPMPKVYIINDPARMLYDWSWPWIMLLLVRPLGFWYYGQSGNWRRLWRMKWVTCEITTSAWGDCFLVWLLVQLDCLWFSARMMLEKDDRDRDVNPIIYAWVDRLYYAAFGNDNPAGNSRQREYSWMLRVYYWPRYRRISKRVGKFAPIRQTNAKTITKFFHCQFVHESFEAWFFETI